MTGPYRSGGEFDPRIDGRLAAADLFAGSVVRNSPVDTVGAGMFLPFSHVMNTAAAYSRRLAICMGQNRMTIALSAAARSTDRTRTGKISSRFQASWVRGLVHVDF